MSSNCHQLQKTARKLVKAQKSRELYHSRANYAKIQVQEFTLETVERETIDLYPLLRNYDVWAKTVIGK